MKKQMLRLALLLATFCIFLCACASSVEEENFDIDFIGTESGIDLDGFELVYNFGCSTTDSIINENVLGFIPNTMFADLARQRIADVEKEYNCKIKINYVDWDKASGDFYNGFIGGSFICDVYNGISDRTADTARIGALIGMSELSDFLDYRNEDKWGPRELLEVVYYKDDLYGLVPFAWPELCHTSFGYPIVVNEDIVSSLGQPDPREYVENKAWDWAQFRKCLEAYTLIEGGQTVHYGLSCHDAYYAEMFLRSNGSTLAKKGPGGTWVSGFSDERAMKAMTEANDIYYGDLGYTIEKTTARDPGACNQLFIDGRAVMSAIGTGGIYGRDASVAQNVSNFGILKWPVGPDVDPDYAFSICENTLYCISFSALSRAPENAALIVNALYEPLPGFETFDDIKAFMEHNYFFDERDCECFFNMYLHQNYNYFHYNIRTLITSYFSENESISASIQKNELTLQSAIDEYVVPSVTAIETLWGSYGG